MITCLFSRLVILACGTLYPGYLSFKTVRAKIPEDYVKWMMYWIVFALFTASETFTDIFLSWFPLYYELKICIILWLLPTMGNGSAVIYKNFIHPMLLKHETRVDHHLEQVRERGQDLLLEYMKEAITYVGRGVMNVVNTNCPNGILGLLASNNAIGNVNYVQERNNILITEELEEEDGKVQHVPNKLPGRKGSTKTSAKNAESNEDMQFEEPQTSRFRSRKARQQSSEIDHNLNES